MSAAVRSVISLQQHRVKNVQERLRPAARLAGMSHNAGGVQRAAKLRSVAQPMTCRRALTGQVTGRRSSVQCNAIDPWSVNAESIASQLFAVSLFPYLAFLFYLNKAKGQPMVNFGFAFLLVFVFATIPAGIYAKKVYGLSLANVDWLHGGAESLLTITNIIIVLGLRQKLEQLANEKKEGGDEAPK